jgi:hypothetical protein
MTQKLLLILLVSIITYAQTSFVKVGYSLKIGYDEGLSIAEGLKDYYAMAQKGAEFVHFDLEVNKAASYFTMKETISNSETSFAISFSDASTSYYTEANSDLKIKYENDSFGEF